MATHVGGLLGFVAQDVNRPFAEHPKPTEQHKGDEGQLPAAVLHDFFVAEPAQFPGLVDWKGCTLSDEPAEELESIP
jgi:hypothetical protein